MQELLKAISARTKSDFDGAWPDAQSEVEQIFSPDVWGVWGAAEPYTPENYNTVWDHEMRRGVVRALEDAGVTQGGYARWLGEIHFVSIAIYRRVLFDSYQQNRGWRILVLSVPAVGTAAVGLASHYQKAQNHDRLAEVSWLLFNHLAAFANNSGLALPGRKVAKSDWTEDGLIGSPISTVAGILLPEPVGGRLFMKDVRTTTLKKILASMISVVPIELAQASAAADLGAALTDLEAIGRAVA